MTTSTAEDERPPLLVLYGSETGNAEQIAKRICDEAKTRGIESGAQTLNRHEKVRGRCVS